MSDRSAYEQRLNAQLREWSARIDQLRARADKASADARIEYQNQLEALEARRQAAARTLDQLQRAGDDAWQELRAGAERAWRELQEAVNSAADRLEAARK